MGRSDLIVESKGQHYVMEIKVARKSSQAKTASREAIKQIIVKGYDRLFPNPVLVGLGISEEMRNIDACVYGGNDKYKRLDMTKRLADALKALETLRLADRPAKAPKPKNPNPRTPKPKALKPKNPKPRGPKP